MRMNKPIRLKKEQYQGPPCEKVRLIGLTDLSSVVLARIHPLDLRTKILALQRSIHKQKHPKVVEYPENTPLRWKECMKALEQESSIVLRQALGPLFFMIRVRKMGPIGCC